MKAALRGSYVEVVFFMGVNERYPMWFSEELYNNIFTDESRYTFYVPRQERTIMYHEKQLVEDYTVFLRKPNGDIHVTDYDAYDALYMTFRFDAFENSAFAAMYDDVIEYVECQGGQVQSGYPDWFYEWVSEAINYPEGEESMLIDVNGQDISITDHCAILQNKFGEIKIMDWDKFLKYYDPDPGY